MAHRLPIEGPQSERLKHPGNQTHLIDPTGHHEAAPGPAPAHATVVDACSVHRPLQRFVRPHDCVDRRDRNEPKVPNSAPC